MNKNMLKYALTALLGTGLGAAIGSYFTYRKVSRDCKKNYENEVSIIKNEYNKKIHNLNEELKHEKIVTDYVEGKLYDIQSKAEASKIVDEFFDGDNENVEIEEPDNLDEEIEEDGYEFVEEGNWPNRAPKKEEDMIRLHNLNMSSTTNAPYVLHNSAEFGEIEGYGLSSLTYYVLNDVLVDEENEEIEHPSFIIGAEAMGVLKTTNLPFIYVRDDVSRVDYEVMINPDTDFYES